MKTLISPSSKSLAILAILAMASGLVSSAFADFSFPNFSDVSSLTLNGAAVQANNGSQDVLRLTPSLDFNAGSAFTTAPISLAADASFSTAFTFQFSDPLDGGADGMVFVVQTVANSVGTGGGGIGYFGIPNSVGVEFDTFNNGLGLGDSDANHVAIDTGGSLASPVAYQNLDSLGQMDLGGIFYSWVDYDGTSDALEVRVNNSPSRPGAPTISATLDLPAILGSTTAFVGFTSGTGAASDNHDVLNWDFRQTFNPVGVPEAISSLPTLMLTFGAMASWAAWHRRKSWGTGGQMT